MYTFDLMVRLVISPTDVNELSHPAHLAKSFAEIPQAVGMLMHAMIKHCMFQRVNIGVKLDVAWNVRDLLRALAEILLYTNSKVMGGLTATLGSFKKVFVVKLSKVN
jgi:hypothetical protein